MKKKLAQLALSAVVFIGIINPVKAAESDYSHSFTDVTEDTRFYDDIMYLSKGYVFGVGWNILNGYEDGTFKPGQSITRAEAAAILVRASGVDFVYNSSTYPDVPKPLRLSQMIATAERHKIVSGYKDGTFRPNNPITRGEMAIMLNRILKLDSDPADPNKNEWLARYNHFHQKENTAPKAFTDVGPASAAYPAVTNLRAFAISTGFPNNEYKPNKLVTRGETAALIYRGLLNAMTISESNLLWDMTFEKNQSSIGKIKKTTACRISFFPEALVDPVSNPETTLFGRYSEGSDRNSGERSELCDRVYGYHVKNTEEAASQKGLYYLDRDSNKAVFLGKGAALQEGALFTFDMQHESLYKTHPFYYIYNMKHTVNVLVDPYSGVLKADVTVDKSGSEAYPILKGDTSPDGTASHNYLNGLVTAKYDAEQKAVVVTRKEQPGTLTREVNPEETYVIPPSYDWALVSFYMPGTNQGAQMHVQVQLME